MVDEAANVAVVDCRGRLVRGGEPSWGRGEGSSDATRGMGKSGRGKHGGHHSRQASVNKGIGLDPDVDWRELWMEGRMPLWIYPLEAFVRFFTGKGWRIARMAMLDMAEVLRFVFRRYPLDDVTLQVSLR